MRAIKNYASAMAYLDTIITMANERKWPLKQTKWEARKAEMIGEILWQS